MAMALSCSRSLCKPTNPYFSSRLKVLRIPQARSQSFRDDEEEEEGNSGNTVDANMSILKYRMERMRMRERHSYKVDENNGWNYYGSNSQNENDDVQKIHNFLVTSFQLAYIVCTNIGLAFLAGSLFIFLLSFILSNP